MGRSVVWLACALVLSGSLTGCGSDKASAPIPQSLSISADRVTVSVIAGRSDSLTLTIGKSGGITGVVSVAAEGFPAGIAVSSAERSSTSSSTVSVVTLSVATTVAPGTYSGTLRASAAGVSSVTAQVSVIVQPIPAISVALTPSTLAINQNASGSITVAMTRTNYAGAATLSVTGLPTGVTGSFDQATTTGTTATLTLAASATAAIGAATVTISVGGTGLTTASSTVSLTVNPAPAYTMSAAPATLTVDIGGTAMTTLTLTRTNFADAVALSAENLPSGVTATFTPPSTSGTTSTVQFAVAASVAAGTSTITLRGTSPGLTDRTVALSLTRVLPPTATVSFASCAVADRAVWFAAQDGDTGVWTRITGSADSYAFVVRSARGAFAWATATSSSSGVSVRYHTQAELTASTIVPCAPAEPTPVSMTGAFANVYTVAALFFGGASIVRPQVGDGVAPVAFTLNGIRPGRHDLLSYTEGERGYIVRNVNAVNGGSLGTINYLGATGFDALVGEGRVANAVTGEVYTASERYHTTTADWVCEAIPLTQLNGFDYDSTFELFGVPPAKQVATDMYQVQVVGDLGGITRTLLESFPNLATRLTTAFVMPSRIAAPAVSISAGATPYKRLTGALAAVPTEYDGPSTLSFSAGTAPKRTMAVTASALWRGGASLTLTTPDLSSVAGWQSSWTPASSETTAWTLQVSNAASTASACTSGLRMLSAKATGSR
jgi:hypothetical protein